MKICVFGGGRWSRVLMRLLPSLLSKKDELIWVSKNNFKEILKVSQDINFKIQCLSDEEVAWSIPPDAVINATASSAHDFYNKKSALLGIPTLSEKPFSMSLKQAHEITDLAVQKSAPLGVNFEFMYASYLIKFTNAIKDISIKTVDIQWHDPFREERHGEIKTAELSTPIVHDSFSHCWSLLKTICPHRPMKKIKSVMYERDSSVSITAAHQGFTSQISLSRRAEARLRKISINKDEAILDFSKEPGFTLHFGKKFENKWSGPKPLESSIGEFLDIVKKPALESGWRLSMERCIDSVRFAEVCAELLSKSHFEVIEKLRHDKQDNLNNSIFAGLLLDIFVPLEAQAGRRYALLTQEQQNNLEKMAFEAYLKGHLISRPIV